MGAGHLCGALAGRNPRSGLALRRRLTSNSYLLRRLEALGPRRRGARTLRRLIAIRGNGPATGSALETRVLCILRRGKLPSPERQYCAGVWRGRPRLVDLCYPIHRIAIEVDSREWHAREPDWQRDIDRYNWLTSNGWKVLRVTSRHTIEDPDYIGREVRRLMGHEELGAGVRWTIDISRKRRALEPEPASNVTRLC